MSPIRRPGIFFFWFLLIFSALMAPWPGWQPIYGNLFRAAANVLFESFGPMGQVRFHPPDKILEGTFPPGVTPPPATHILDTRIELRSRRSPGLMGFSRIGSRHTGYTPTAFIVALILATPIPWGRKWRALLPGILCVQVFVAVRVTIALVFAFSGDNPVALFHPSPFWSKVLYDVYRVALPSFAGSYIAPLPIWFLVTFRRGDFKRLIRPKSSPGDEAPRATSARAR